MLAESLTICLNLFCFICLNIANGKQIAITGLHAQEYEIATLLTKVIYVNMISCFKYKCYTSREGHLIHWMLWCSILGDDFLDM